MNIQRIESEYRLFSLYDIDVLDIRKTPIKSLVANNYIIDICDNNNFKDVEVRIWNMIEEHLLL